jgi:hypothetical protein
MRELYRRLTYDCRCDWTVFDSQLFSSEDFRALTKAMRRHQRSGQEHDPHARAKALFGLKKNWGHISEEARLTFNITFNLFGLQKKSRHIAPHLVVEACLIFDRGDVLRVTVTALREIPWLIKLWQMSPWIKPMNNVIIIIILIRPLVSALSRCKVSQSGDEMRYVHCLCLLTTEGSVANGYSEAWRGTSRKHAPRRVRGKESLAYDPSTLWSFRFWP